MDSPRAAALPGSARVLLVGAVAEMVTGRYEEMARDLVTTSRKTESSLKRLSARRGGAGAAPGGAPGGGGDAGLSDTDKICRQLQLDVAEFGRQLGRFGLEAAAMPCFKALQAAVDETA